ncbi:S8 family serine peptidase [Roseateles toxinivorans]|uniref:Subtilisin family serine protease n=1 Tax=Roseateles toxinivorans TaxID=270368 RepID=A0A4R6QNR0_9BURK|nr:S8 family serine peptidase [Roseateles toxinivorans]TDP72626.1 subtilisin family serine protease [Roseateles toxinivorans]
MRWAFATRFQRLMAGGLGLLISLQTGHSLAAAADPAATVVALSKLSELRVSRTVFDYVFRVTVKNGPAAQTDVRAYVEGAGTGTTVIDGNVLVGNLAAGASATPPDTITLRHDRNVAFNPAALRWRVEGTLPLELQPLIVKPTPPEQHVQLSSGLTVAKAQLLVVVRESLNASGASALFASLGARVVGHIPEAYTYQLEFDGVSDEAALTQAKATLTAHPGVLNVSFNTIARSSSTEWLPKGGRYADQAWALQKIKSEDAWQEVNRHTRLGRVTKKSKIGIIDSGFISDHEDIRFAAIYGPAGEQATEAGLPPPISEESKSNLDTYAVAWMRLHHGMNVAGIIGAHGRNETGIAGVAWQVDAPIYAARSDFTEMSILTHIARLAKQGVKVINISMGPSFSKDSSASTKMAASASSAVTFGNLVQRLAARHDFLVVTSAGNDQDHAAANSFFGHLFLPEWANYAAYEMARSRVLVVGAVAPGSPFKDDGFAEAYSNFGPGVVELLAPGGGSWCRSKEVSDPPGYHYQHPGWAGFHCTVESPMTPTRRGIVGLGAAQGRTTTFHGTSQAAPHVTGAAALAWFLNPELSAAQVKQLLIGSSTEPVKRANGESYPQLNLLKVVTQAIATTGTAPPPAAVTSSTIITSVQCRDASSGGMLAEVPLQITPSTAPQNNVGAPQLFTDANGVHVVDLAHELLTTYATDVFMLRLGATPRSRAYVRAFRFPLQTVQNIRNLNVTFWAGEASDCSGMESPVEVDISGSGLSIDPPSRLNDTGVGADQCYRANNDGLESCVSAAALALSPRQDGMVGRDAGLNDAADGRLGFSFSEVPGHARTECVNDKVTGLMWEGKPSDGGSRDAALQYSNYDDGRPGDASAYVAAVNAEGLCGYSDWRLPDVDELLGLIDYGAAIAGRFIDRDWFPNTMESLYWTSRRAAGQEQQQAWMVPFSRGWTAYVDAGAQFHVRLVRGNR